MLADGYAAGAQAAYRAGFGSGLRRSAPPSPPASASPQIAPPAGHKAFVDFQNDVTANDLKLAEREGFRSIEHVKRYTTAGMGTDQGKTSNVNALQLVAHNLGKPIADLGLTTFRMPYTPVTFGTLAGMNRGALFDPVRTTPMLRAIKADLGYDIPFDNKNSGQALSQLIAEKNNPVADLAYYGVNFGMVITLSLGEFNLTWMLHTPLTKTLPVGLADSYASMRLEVASAYTLIFFVMIVPLLVAMQLFADRATRAGTSRADA